MKVFDRSGVFFKFHGDIIKWRWPWARNLFSATYHSSLLNRDFNSFKEYWVSCGEDRALIKFSSGTGKLHGFELTEEILPQWSARLWPNEFIVCMFNVNPMAKGPKFWSMLDKFKRSELLKDVVILRCKDKTEMETLLDAIDVNFASAISLFNGQLQGSNSQGTY